MATWEHLPVLIAMMLTMAAALISSDTEARQEVAAFVRAVLKPQSAVTPREAPNDRL